MEIVSEKTYNVMDGEPALGRQVEMVVAVDRDEYIDALVDAFINGNTETTDTFEIHDKDIGIQEYHLGCDLDQSEIDSILREMDMQLLDDDYGTDKANSLLYDLLDAYIPDNWSDEFEIINMK